MAQLHRRLKALEGQRAARTARATGNMTLAEWRAARAARGPETVEEWLARVRAGVGRWPEGQRAEMLRQWELTAETLRMMDLEGGQE